MHIGSQIEVFCHVLLGYGVEEGKGGGGGGGHVVCQGSEECARSGAHSLLPLPLSEP